MPNRMRHRKLFHCYALITIGLAIGMLMFKVSIGHAERAKVENWVCYYGNQLGPESYGLFDLAVLDGLYPPVLAGAGGKKPLFIGYVSIGEVHGSGPYWEMAKGKPFLIHENTLWQSWVVDVRDPQWQKLLLDRVFVSVIAKGFDGFFLDTIDSALHLAEGKDGRKFADTDKAIVDLIKKMRRRYPDKLIAVNRGLPLLPRIAKDIDYIVIENLYSTYNAEKKEYERVDPVTQKILINQVRAGQKVKPSLVVLTVDYAAPEQESLAAEAIDFSRKNGFIPYVGNHVLDQIYFYTLKK